MLPDGRFAPRRRIFATCRHLIRTLGLLMTDEKNPRDAARDPHELTHAPDALRYFAIFWYKPPAEKNNTPHLWTEDMWEDYYAADESFRERMERTWKR